MKIIGLCGFAGSGKDTAFRHLPLSGWRRYAFADPLKEDIRLLPGMVGVDLGDPATKEVVRPLLVAYGVVMRALYPGYWIQRTMRRIDNDDFLGLLAVITDCRFLDEVNEIHARGGLVILIRRPGVGPRNQEEEDSFMEIHKSGPALPVVLNDSTPEDLGMRVARKIEEHFNGQ